MAAWLRLVATSSMLAWWALAVGPGKLMGASVDPTKCPVGKRMERKPTLGVALVADASMLSVRWASFAYDTRKMWGRPKNATTSDTMAGQYH